MVAVCFQEEERLIKKRFLKMHIILIILYKSSITKETKAVIVLTIYNNIW